MPKKKSNKEFVSQISTRNLVALDQYINKRTKIRFKCLLDGHIWMALPGEILRGGGCPKCAGKCGNDILSDHGDWIEIDISTKRFPRATMLIDKEDWNSILESGYGRVTPVGTKSHVYGVTRKNGTQEKIHRIILNPKECVDHINRNTLDNRKINLRVCSRKENNRNRGISINNTSGTTGVYRNKASSTWDAFVWIDSVQKYLGSYVTKEEAIKARRLAETERYKNFAPTHHHRKESV